VARAAGNALPAVEDRAGRFGYLHEIATQMREQLSFHGAKT